MVLKATCDVLIGFQNITCAHKSWNALGSFDFPNLYLIQQTDSMLPYVCPVIDHRWGQNVERTKKWHTGAAECATNVLTTFWRLLWSIYTHVIIECFGFTWYQEKMLLMVTSSIRLSFNRSQLTTNQNTYTIVYLGSLSTKTPSSPEFVIMCHIFMPQCSKHLLREILPVNHIFGL